MGQSASGTCITAKKRPSWRNGIGETLVVDGLGDVDVSAQIVAALDFPAIVGGGEHDHRRSPHVPVRLEAFEDFDAGHVRQIEIEQDEQLPTTAHLAGTIGAEQIGQRFGSVGERENLIVHACPADVLFNEARMPLVVLDHYDHDRPRVLNHVTAPITFRRSGGMLSIIVVPLVSSELTVISPPRLRIMVRTCASPIPSPG